jgi:hypothetical protein
MSSPTLAPWIHRVSFCSPFVQSQKPGAGRDVAAGRRAVVLAYLMFKNSTYIAKTGLPWSCHFPLSVGQLLAVFSIELWKCVLEPFG